jgi:hypothetical protein
LADGWNHLVFDFSQSGLDLSRIDNLLFFADPGVAGSSGNFVMDSLALEVRQPLVLEDFEDGDLWTPDTTLGWWDVDGSAVYARWTALDPSRGGLGSMHVGYNKNGLPWSFFGGHLSEANPLRDFTQARKLTFWVNGASTVMVKLRDRQMAEVELGTVSFEKWVGWTKVTLDYSQLQGINLTDIDNILFFVAPGEEQATGTFHIDDIALEE